jgi:hypothetical protein
LPGSEKYVQISKDFVGLKKEGFAYDITILK